MAKLNVCGDFAVIITEVYVERHLFVCIMASLKYNGLTRQNVALFRGDLVNLQHSYYIINRNVIWIADVGIRMNII